MNGRAFSRRKKQHETIQTQTSVVPALPRHNVQKKITTYPMQMVDGRQINIGRVSVQECENCHHLVPTKAGSEKISRCMGSIAAMFYGD